MRIAIERRADPRCRPFLEAVAQNCRQLGHDVVAWAGPYSRRLKFVASPLPSCDLAIVWNGLNHRYVRPLRHLRQRRVPVLFAELGWYPQKGTYQLDPSGINFGASWVREPVEVATQTSLPVPDGHDLLLLLQVEGDTQITHYSPHFRDMAELIHHVGCHSQLPVRVRCHPLSRPSMAARRLLRRTNCRIDRSPSLREALHGACAVTCINSSAALEAMDAGLPVLSYGRSVFEHPEAVYVMDGTAEQTHAVTSELAAGQCSLNRTAMDAVIARVRAHQIPIANLPRQLPDLLETAVTANGFSGSFSGNHCIAADRYPSKVSTAP
ncbi:hypothetical protein [Maioricimonas sp. JC845]|uniref:capsular polysaccharide export protein, LipB/KpsS family n=1 Tax=Maioricimonas sp. JC845 TaxID=3232138 RepID=UPI0034589A03